MNGAVYISFFQGQLESVLEQVVQLAVQEISKTVGSSLNALLLETAAKEKENNRLRLLLQARENRARSSPSEDGGSAAAGRSKAERGDGGRTKPEPRGAGAEPAVPIDTRRLEQRGRAVGKQPFHDAQEATQKPWSLRGSDGCVSRSELRVNRRHKQRGPQVVRPGSTGFPVPFTRAEEPQRAGSRED